MFRGMSEIRMVKSVAKASARGGLEFVCIYSFNLPARRRAGSTSTAQMEARGGRGCVPDPRTWTPPGKWLGEQFIADAEALLRPRT